MTRSVGALLPGGAPTERDRRPLYSARMHKDPRSMPKTGLNT